MPGGFLVDLKKADRSGLKNLRRADRLSKLSVLAAKEALRDACLAPEGGNIEAGVILCTALGPHPTTFRFLDDIIEYGDNSVSPTTFSNSVHNAAASYIAADCGIEGPTLTITQFFHSFHEGLALALSWLREGRLQRVLLGAAEVHGEVLQHVASRMLGAPSADGVLRPLEFKAGGKHVPGEGAVFMVLEKNPEGAYCGLDVETGFKAGPGGSDGSLLLLDSDGLIKDETGYPGLIPREVPVGSHASHYGSMMSGSAFNTAAGALVLKEQRVFPYPFPQEGRPQGISIADERTDPPRTVEVLRLDCSGRRGLVRLSAM
jgi:3-oxoacyl-[acyl-carrier-protein] synthase II